MIKASKTIVVLLAVAAFALTASTYASITVNQSLSSSGTISTTPNIGVYSDSACTTPITSLTWGSLSPGASTSQTVYIKNTGTASMTLSMTTSSWSPSNAGTYITLSWNKEGVNLPAGISTAATLTVTVSSTINSITTFGNTITISGTS